MASLEYKAGIFALTGICGLIDAACFLALGGVFAELMTGNFLLLAFSIGTHSLEWGRIIAYVGAIGPFCIGALLTGLICNGKIPVGSRLIGYPVEFAAIATATLLAIITNPTPVPPLEAEIHTNPHPTWQQLTIVGLLAFAMGIHNALMRKRGVPDVATNVMTLTLTGFVSESRLAGGKAPHWQRRIGSILIFIVGAAAGAWLLQFGVAAPLIAATLVFAIALWPLMKGRADPGPITGYAKTDPEPAT